MIEARHLGFLAGSTVLIDDVSLAADSGSIVALTGPNGAGKSTLVRMLAGELSPARGEVLLNGRVLKGITLRERAKVRAVLAQSSDLTFPFSADDVVMLGRAPHVEGRETLHDRAIVDLAMHATDTRKYADRAYPTLSGGEKQRVHAARAIAQVWEGPTPRVLLLDEPTSSLDLVHQHALLQFARRMASDGCAVICALHDLNLAAQYADRIAVLERGRLIAFGAPADVLTPALLADVFRVRACVVPHPELPCPLIVPIGPAARVTKTPSEQERIDAP